MVKSKFDSAFKFKLGEKVSLMPGKLGCYLIFRRELMEDLDAPGRWRPVYNIRSGMGSCQVMEPELMKLPPQAVELDASFLDGFKAKAEKKHGTKK